MGDYSLLGNANWSAIKAAVTAVAAPRRIVPTGAWTLTLDESPLIACEFDATGTAGTVAIGELGAYDLTGWLFKAGATWGFAGQILKTVTGGTFIGGATASSYGAVPGTGTFVGSVFRAGTAAAGCNAQGGAFINCNGIALGTVSAVYSYGASVFGGTWTGAAAPALFNAGMAVLDARLLAGNAVQRYSGLLALYGGSSLVNTSGTGGILKIIPTIADVRLGSPVVDELGTANVFTGDADDSGTLSTGQIVYSRTSPAVAPASSVLVTESNLGIPGEFRLPAPTPRIRLGRRR